VKDPLQSSTGLASALGPLELRVLEDLWARRAPATVRDLVEAFPGVAYTTLMTTADRLFRKGLLVRERDGRAFRYRPRWSRAELDLHLASAAIATWLADDPRTLRPLVSLFVDEVTRRDESMLDELERLIRQKKGGGG
jgi:predicted transcriptional regulator